MTRIPWHNTWYYISSVFLWRCSKPTSVFIGVWSLFSPVSLLHYSKVSSFNRLYCNHHLINIFQDHLCSLFSWPTWSNSSSYFWLFAILKDFKVCKRSATKSASSTMPHATYCTGCTQRKTKDVKSALTR